MKKIIGLFFMLIIFSSHVFSQFEEKIKKENVVIGSITKDGKEIIGYIKAIRTVVYENNAEFSSPWNFQNDIDFIPKEVFETTAKIKNKLFESYGPKDIDGYKYEDNIYVSLKYQDLSAVGTGMFPKMVFMRQISAGKISTFYNYDFPPSIVTGSFAPEYTRCNKPHLIYKKGKDGKAKLVNDLNIEKELADCPYVIEKHKKGEYKAIGGEGESSGFNKLVNNTLYKEQVRVNAIEDYNLHCN